MAGFTLRVHEYAVNPQTAERELVEYRPLLRLGCSSPDGYSGEMVYLQGGCVYGEGGAAYAPESLPDWFGAALAAVSPQALADVGFTSEVIEGYLQAALQDEDEATGWAQPPEEAPWPTHDVDAPHPTYPPGFKPDQWVLGWICAKGHDYQQTGQSRYNKRMQCVDCDMLKDRMRRARRKDATREKPGV